MKKHFKRALSLLLAILLCIGMLPVSASAADLTGSMSMIDIKGRNHALSSSLPAPFGGYASEKYTMLRITDSSTGATKTAYCLELGISTYYQEQYQPSADYPQFSQEQKELINAALTLGYNTDTGVKYGGSPEDEYIATQILVWLIAHKQLGTQYENQIVSEFTVNSPGAKTVFTKLRKAVMDYRTIPSFACEDSKYASSHTYELKYNAQTGKYETTLTDSNGVLSEFSFSQPGISFARTGNQLKISSEKTSFSTVSGEKKLPSSIAGVVKGASRYWLNEHYQNVVTFEVGGEPLPVKAYFGLEVKAGHLKIVKTSEDGKVSGLPFHVSGSGVEKDVSTGPDGTVQTNNLPAGTYTVTEKTPGQYVQPQSQRVTVSPGKTSVAAFHNTLKKFRAELRKTDSAAGTAQGDSTLDGAVYGLYQNGALLDTYTTANGGKFTTKYYPCGSGYAMQEISPSEGYLLDETVYPIGAEPGNFTLENNSIPLTVTEDSVMGSIAITKHTDQPAEGGGSDQIEQPEQGAQFQVYLTSAGSYENAKETERDVLLTNEYGFDQSKDLPYGKYTVHQTSGAEGQKLAPDFTVFISEHGKTYYFILNNPSFTSRLKFQKKDAETGKIIPLAGTAVKILNTDTGKWVTQHISYPSPIDLDTFITDSTGTLMLPEEIRAGNYALYEQQSPWGYVLDREPVYFSVEETEETVVVEKYNAPQKGTITVTKEGEVFSHVTEAGGIYQPQYETKGLPNAVYDITALEDIVTPDGTIRAKAGEVVDTLTTGSKGTDTSAPLYLGRYQVLERKASEGMVRDPEPKEVVLSYAGQEVSVTNTGVSFSNERQKVEISLKKLLEQNETFGVGGNEEWKNVTFGLFAAEKLTAADGTLIPADGLLETIGLDEGGNAVFQTDVPCGAALYVQELETDEHYVLSGKKYPVAFEYAGQDTAKVEIKVNHGEPIENNLKYGKISGWKADQDGFGLGGSKIGLFRVGETEFTEETALMVTESNPIGYFEFNKVPAGSWEIHEIAPPKAFVLNEEIFPAEITEDGETIEITIQNQIIRGTVETTKADADYPENKLTGAVFEVYADVDSNGEFNSDIDLLAGELAESDPGHYQLKDLVYGDYFLHEQKAPEFFEKDDGYYPFSITENGAIVRVETKAGAGFLNQAQTGTLKIVKTADDDKIEGRKFLVTGTAYADGGYEQEFQTDEKGEISVTLRVGKYTVSELPGKDAAAYELPSGQTVEIKAGETVTVAMHNRLIPKELPKTGDLPWLPWTIGGAAVLSLVGLGVLLALRRRKKR